MTVGGLATVNYDYNSANQLTSVTQGSISASLSCDGAGRPRTVTLPDGIVETSSYDDASEPTGVTYSSGATTLGDLAYGYDQAGRRTGVWGSFARTGLPDATTQDATYNANNRLTSWNGTSLTYDPNGNLTSYGTQTFTWNDRNQLASTSGGSASFAYDGVGKRVSKTVGGATTKYLYDGANVVQEQDSSNVATANLLTGLGIDQVFSRTDLAGARSFLTDALGSTIALADASGAITTFYTYEPFGAATASGSPSTNSFQFTGRENDGATGLFFYRARYSSPTFSRFISEDPLGFPGGSDVNLYAYVGNDPVTLTDPFGLDPGNGCGFLGWSCTASFFADRFSSLWDWVVENRWQILTAVSAFACMIPATFACGFVLGGVFLAKEFEIFVQAGGFNAEFLKSTLYNAGTTALTYAGGGLLAKTATKGTYVALASRWGGELFYNGLPTAVCATIEPCASPHWPPG